MAYQKINTRSIRLFAATPEELERNRPLLNGAFRCSRIELEKALEDNPGTDIFLALSVWKRAGQDGKPDYYTAELCVLPPDKQAERLEKDEEWLKAHPRSAKDNERKKQYAINKAAAQRAGIDEPWANEVPF